MNEMEMPAIPENMLRTSPVSRTLAADTSALVRAENSTEREATPRGDDTIACEAIKISYRQTREGNVVSFRIHPDNSDKHIADLPLGVRVMLGVAIIEESK